MSTPNSQFPIPKVVSNDSSGSFWELAVGRWELAKRSFAAAAAATRNLYRPHRLAVRSDERSDATARPASTRTTATGAAFATRSAAGAAAARALLAGTRTGSLSRILLRHVAARPVHHVEREGPEVVSSLILVDPDRRFGALARDAHDAATSETTLLTRLALRRRRAAAAARAAAVWRRPAAAVWHRPAAPGRCRQESRGTRRPASSDSLYFFRR